MYAYVRVKSAAFKRCVEVSRLALFFSVGSLGAAASELGRWQLKKRSPQALALPKGRRRNSAAHTNNRLDKPKIVK